MTYAGIRAGWVIETYTPMPEWEHIHPADIFARDLFDEWVPIDGLDPRPTYGWRYADGGFAEPTPEDAGARRRALIAWDERRRAR